MNAALAYSEPPEGYSRRSARLLADKAVEIGYFEHLSHTKAPVFSKKQTKTPS
jgi:hypothetical protein